MEAHCHTCECGRIAVARRPGSIWSCQRCLDGDEIAKDWHLRVQFEQQPDPDWDKSVVGLTKRQRDYKRYWDRKKEMAR